MSRITSVNEVKFGRIDANVQIIGPEVEEAYEEAGACAFHFQEALARQKDLKIVYSSLHGTGITLVPRILEAMGFRNVTVVQEQATPDGNFPTVKYPNPEEQEAMSIALAKAKELDADLVLATDPDADRVGIAVKNHHGEFQLLNGNQTGSLLIYYMLQAWKEAGKITGREFVAKTIVTTDLIDKMAASFGIDCPNTLTGFKYIAAVIREREGKGQFIAGGEESYGYLVGDFVRDKDAVSSCAMIAELVAYAKDKGKGLFDMMMEVYGQYGFYYETLISLTKKGKSGAEEIRQMMTTLRNNPPQTVAGSPLVQLIDYENRIQTDILTGKQTPITLEKSDVLQFITRDGSKISARPSGTEPNINFFVSVIEPLARMLYFAGVMKKLL